MFNQSHRSVTPITDFGYGSQKIIQLSCHSKIIAIEFCLRCKLRVFRSKKNIPTEIEDRGRDK